MPDSFANTAQLHPSRSYLDQNALSDFYHKPKTVTTVPESKIIPKTGTTKPLILDHVKHRRECRELEPLAPFEDDFSKQDKKNYNLYLTD